MTIRVVGPDDDGLLWIHANAEGLQGAVSVRADSIAGRAFLAERAAPPRSEDPPDAGSEDWSHRCPECGATVCSHAVLMVRSAAMHALRAAKDVMPDVASAHRAIEGLMTPAGTCPPECRGIRVDVGDPAGWSGCRCRGAECDCPQHRRLAGPRSEAPPDAPGLTRMGGEVCGVCQGYGRVVTKDGPKDCPGKDCSHGRIRRPPVTLAVTVVGPPVWRPGPPQSPPPGACTCVIGPSSVVPSPSCPQHGHSLIPGRR